ncbi:response regulator [candidate division KSB3 bacterium]|uniref:Response regulator n=1 Tax=candidate division KSB3 bacterium TaxID=2044937 RepID=A0A9D5Q915_9BACT|nr:response regulator [candidate division KSB3 bacterium]MBD3327421.1 response regulator [candidate division KSB3 bacterium]
MRALCKMCLLHLGIVDEKFSPHDRGEGSGQVCAGDDHRVMNILLIDDESNFLKLLRHPLLEHGHTITEAYDGKQGWQLFSDTPARFDVIITDVEMPMLNGVGLLKRLRENGYDTPVVVMTAYKEIQTLIEVLRLGAFDFLLKPFTAKALLDILTKLETIQEHHKAQFTALPSFTETIELTIPSQTDLILKVRSFLQDRLKAFCKFHAIDERNIVLCLHEALVNAIIHGNLEIPSEVKLDSADTFEQLVRQREADPHFAERLVAIRCQITPCALTFAITDEGKGFDPEQFRYADPVEFNPGGRGLLIITSVMDEVSWNETGNCITMLKYFS